MPLLTGAGMDFEARTTTPSTLIRLPGVLVRAQFAKPAGLAFLASTGWNRDSTDRPTIAPATDGRPVAELVHGEVLTVGPSDPVRDVVVRMTEHHVSYALIRLTDGGLGIFTDRDLRARVVAAGLPVDVPIAEVMSAPARTVTADLTADSVLMEMLECGLRHMPVLTPRGEVVGVLEDADLLAASARQSFMLRRSIGLATDTAELQQVGHRVTGIAVELFRNGTKASATSAILSVVIDSLVRRAVELVLAQSDSPALGGFAWLTLGSVARREAMPSSDVDVHCRGETTSSSRPRGSVRWPPTCMICSTAAGCRRTATARPPPRSGSRGPGRNGCARPADGWTTRFAIAGSSCRRCSSTGAWSGETRACTRCRTCISGCATSIRTRCGCSC